MKIINGSSDLFFSRNVTIFYQESRLSLIEFWNEMTSNEVEIYNYKND